MDFKLVLELGETLSGLGVGFEGYVCRRKDKLGRKLAGKHK